MSETFVSPTLNEELVKLALQSYHNINNTSALVLKACSFKLSSASGENFCSKIYQVYVQYEVNGNTDSKSFIVKIMLPEIAGSSANEEIMFNTVLPGMEKCLNFVEAESENKLHPKCLLSKNKSEEEFYVLENLNSMGYYCADRTKGLNGAQALLLMKKIAKFHAASMIFAFKFPTVVESLNGSIFENGASNDTMKAIAFGGLEYVAQMIGNWPSHQNLAQKVHAIIPKFNRLVMDAVDSQNSKFNVITHGDLWVNNFLYKYDSSTGKPVDVLFVDFQNSFWGSCGFDLNWFLYTSLELKVLKQNRQQLIQAYYDTLNQTLYKNNYLEHKIPTLEDVLGEIKRTEIIGFYTSLCELPIIALEKSKTPEFNYNTFTQCEEISKIRVLMYENPRVKETLEFTLKYFEAINMI